MRVESVDFFYFKMPVVTDEGDGSQDALLVRVQAGGYEGWGECEAAPLPTIAAWCCPMSHGACRPVKASVLGERLDTPEDIVRINAQVRENSLDLLQADHTLSGVDIALWDALARSRGVPVHSLLGVETVHPKTPYASALFGDTPEATYHKAREVRAAGFPAVKFGWNGFGRRSSEEDIAQVRAAREGMGSDATVMVDVGTIWKDDVEAAAARLPGLAELDVTWLEEPFVSGALDAYRELADRSPSVPLAAGEGAHNFHMAKMLIDTGAVDYIQIDTGRIGGITTSRQVAEYSRGRCRYVNHTFTSMLALSASLAPYWDLLDSSLCEYPFQPKPLCRELSKDRLEVRDGTILPLSSPGLGVTPDLEALRAYRVDVRIEVNGEVLYETPAW